MADYRSDPMPSAEGRGRAKRAWDAYQRGTRKASDPLLMPLAKTVSANLIADLLGFWVVWHLEGGFEGVRRAGMSRASIYRKIALFRKLFGVHPDEFEMPGVTVDVPAYRAGSRAALEKMRKARSDSLIS